MTTTVDQRYPELWARIGAPWARLDGIQGESVGLTPCVRVCVERWMGRWTKGPANFREACSRGGIRVRSRSEGATA